MIPFTDEQIRSYEERGWWGKKTLLDYIEENAGNSSGTSLPHCCLCEKRVDPGSVAYVDGRGNWATWVQVKTMIDRLAIAFSRLGIKEDDFVIIQMPNVIEFIYSHFALAKLGAVTVPVVMPFRQHELSVILGLTGASAAIIPGQYNNFDYQAMYKELSGQYPFLKHIVVYGEDANDTISLRGLLEVPWEEQDPGQAGRLGPDPNAVISMCLTSGTEAVLKGVPRTHNNWIALAEIIVHDAWGRNRSSHTTVMPLPLPNLFGLGCGIYAQVMLGQKMVLLERFDPEECLQAIAEHRATHFMGVPAMHIALLNSPAFDRYDLSSLETIISGGAPAPTAMIEEYRKRLGVRVMNGWGANEGTFCGTRLDQREHLSDSIGPHPPSYEMKIVHPETREILPPGSVGEIAMRGPCLFPGYYGRPDLNAKAFDAEGFFYSGDLGVLGLDGYYRFAGRVKDLIIRGGQNISAEEIEFLLQEHPKVLYVAAVGMPDERLGEKVCVYIQPRTPGDRISLEEVNDFLRRKQIATFKLPERVEIIDQLPRTPTGKVQKFVLRQDVAAKVGRGS